ncbi:MAG TPA: isoprenylcysteine carboxylmethyltransferase family protein [Firmicutes bacterium]|nr:isoprenylcysteine carboxylmethyltransferase family protein [Bacillota bacterium]
MKKIPFINGLTVDETGHTLNAMLGTVNATPPDRAPIKKWAKLRLWVGYLYILLAMIFAKPVFFWTIVGIILVIIGVIIRLIASGTLIKDSVLCTTGIYSATRNPLYLGSALIGLGFASLTSSLWFLAGFLFILSPLYWRMIKLEENYLSLLYPGTFDEYRKSVPAFLPRHSSMRSIPGTVDTNLLKKSRELTTSVIVIGLMVILVAIHALWQPC